MRFEVAKFAVPDCALADPMHGNTFKLLIYLLKTARKGGECEPGYRAMKQAMRDTESDKGSDNSVKRALAELDRLGWIFRRQRTAGIMRIYLRIPSRHNVITNCHSSSSGSAINGVSGSAIVAERANCHDGRTHIDTRARPPVRAKKDALTEKQTS